MGSFSSSKNASDEIVIQGQQVSLAYTGSPKALLETLQLFFPLGESSAIINQLIKNQEATMAAFETIDAKLNQVAAAIATEATEVKAEIDKLKALAASDKITPEQLEAISTRFDGVIAAINGIIVPEPASTADPVA